MSEEPSNSNAEPVGEMPIGESGSTQPTEPEVSESEEPQDSVSKEPSVSEESTEEPKDEETFMDLKSVPPELQPAAKKLQATFTKRMQELKSREDLDNNVESQEEVPADVTEMKQYLETSPQGQALKSVFREMLQEEVGDVRQFVMDEQADKAIDAAITTYGKEPLEQNIDQILGEWDKNPLIPLEYVCAKVLYGQSKQAGKDEFRRTLAKKSEASTPANTSSPIVRERSEYNNFGDAAAAAFREHGVDV